MPYDSISKKCDLLYTPKNYRFSGGSHRRVAIKEMHKRRELVQTILRLIRVKNEKEGAKMMDNFAGIYWDDTNKSQVACVCPTLGWKMIFNAASKRGVIDLFMDIIHEYTHVATGLQNHGERFMWECEKRVAKYIPIFIEHAAELGLSPQPLRLRKRK